jgi:FtsP/CotA-like multicopper oxidase with cupredoxin domain
MASRKNSPAKRLPAVVLLTLCGGAGAGALHAQGLPAPKVNARVQQQASGPPPRNTCPARRPGSMVGEPEDLRSVNGELKVDLTLHNYKEADGSTRYCYTTPDGKESPTLRLNPGDLLILNLKNDLREYDSNDAPGGAASAGNHHLHIDEKQKTDPCVSGLMTPTSTNLHFHGLTIPSTCHQDEVLNTSIQPQDSPFQYRFRIPANEPPGLYWYHPHIHGFSKAQVLGGASGAIIVEGIERAVKEVAGLPERVLVIRDRDLLNPDAPPSKSEPKLPPNLIDRDGDAVNNGTGFGKPAKDLSINFVPAPWPDYLPAVMEMKPGERQLWRVLNASAITYLNLELLFDRKAQPLGLIALDGVPLNENGKPGDAVNWQTHLGVPPGGRAEFIVTGPPAQTQGLLVTRSVDTGPAGENDPNRAIARIVASAEAPEPRSRLAARPGPSTQPLSPLGVPWLGDAKPARTRRLYFSEKPLDPANPSGPTEFFITVDGQTPVAFDPKSGIPNIVAQQGTVEDWIIENRSNELHAFHIHQLHFLLLDYLGRAVNEPYLRDTVNVPYYNGRSLVYPSIRLRMDFRDPDTIGTFVYHCHLLEHEDGGMMGLIRVESSSSGQTPSK